MSHKLRIGSVLFIAMVLLLPNLLSGQEDIEYRDRGNRHEGVKRKPVSAGDIELVSALADYSEQSVGFPDQFRMNFYLPEQSKVFVTVREIDCVNYYWMDQLKPQMPWRKGGKNEFAWPTKDVVRKLVGLSLDKLGAVARLYREEPAREEHIAPVILYHSTLPTTVNRYIFVVRASGSARLQACLYAERGKQASESQNFDRVFGGRPLAIKCDCSGLPAGQYKLVLKGYILDNNDPLVKVLHFYHQPNLGSEP